MTWRLRLLVIAGIAITSALVITGCARREAVGIEFGGQHTIAVSADGRHLHFAVPTCNGKPTVRVVEDERAVHLLVTSKTGNSDKCADLATVTLRSPLGQRTIIDDKTGKAVPDEH